MADVTVIIPTYWTWPANESQRPVKASFDHPTPLDGESTLPPLLGDLWCQRNKDFDVLILTGLEHPDLGRTVSTHVHSLLAPFRQRLKLRICDPSAWEELSRKLHPTSAQMELLHLGSYSGIRNLQLLLPHILGARVIVALDDDERVEPDYVDQALKFIGNSHKGKRVLGVAGPYLQRDGSVQLDESPLTGNPFLDKSHYINQAMGSLMNVKDSLITTPITLGGNMLFHRDLFTRVCFDPGITRGEDIDYLINARLRGITWWFDPRLTILHLPPRQHETPLYQRMREDVFRFLYEREKLRLNGHSRPAWLEPYPGALLGEDLAAQALAALQQQAAPNFTNSLGEPRTIVAEAQANAINNASRYPTFRREWETLMARIEQDAALRDILAAVIPQL